MRTTQSGCQGKKVTCRLVWTTKVTTGLVFRHSLASRVASATLWSPFVYNWWPLVAIFFERKTFSLKMLFKAVATWSVFKFPNQIRLKIVHEQHFHFQDRKRGTENGCILFVSNFSTNSAHEKRIRFLVKSSNARFRFYCRLIANEIKHAKEMFSLTLFKIVNRWCFLLETVILYVWEYWSRYFFFWPPFWSNISFF